VPEGRSWCLCQMRDAASRSLRSDESLHGVAVDTGLKLASTHHGPLYSSPGVCSGGAAPWQHNVVRGTMSAFIVQNRLDVKSGRHHGCGSVYAQNVRACSLLSSARTHGLLLNAYLGGRRCVTAGDCGSTRFPHLHPLDARGTLDFSLESCTPQYAECLCSA
jgi:hypothetical protein